MIQKNALDRFCWILNVLESCKNEDQIKTTQNLFENFMRQNRKQMISSHIETFNRVFDSEKKTISLNLRRKTKFISSKFYSF